MKVLAVSGVVAVTATAGESNFKRLLIKELFEISL